MDRPVLDILARELAESESLVAFSDELGRADARVSEPALPLLLAALHLRLERGLVCLLPDDAEARDAAEAAAWFLGEDDVAFMPSRGVSFDSGLEPPPHLVGERFRSLDVLAAGGLVCVSAAAIAEPLPPPDARPEPIAVRPGDEPGVTGLAERLALAGYERVERAEERGQFAVRGGIVDVYPVTGREPVRVELFGDEVEAIRAFSPFTQRALRALDAALLLSGFRAAPRPRRPRRGAVAGRDRGSGVGGRSRAGAPGRARPRLAAGGRARGVARRARRGARARRRRRCSTRCRRASCTRSRRSGRHSRRAGSQKPRTSCRASFAAASASSSRSRTAARRFARRTCSGASTPA